MPALVKSSVGSSAGTRDELATTLWPCCSKYFRNDDRMSLDVMDVNSCSSLGCTAFCQTQDQPEKTTIVAGCCAGVSRPGGAGRDRARTPEQAGTDRAA